MRTAKSGEAAMLHKAIFALLIAILTMGAASAQQREDLEHIRAGENSMRTEQEKNNDIATDRAYQSTLKRFPAPEKKKPDPWADVRPTPPAAAKNN
jgi:hypothetical protein